ncbi:MAG: cytidylate kinase-like family protein [Clostridiales bacterium]|nr:cytidylate kinase-like family protein [Clostridiales bacterium]
MNIITISREFGSGGRELGKRVAEILGMEYYDKEIISAIANKQGMDEKYVESASNGQGWRGMALTTRRSFAYLNAGNTATIHILLEEKRALEAIAALKKDCVIVGRNADVILAKEQPFNVFVCADMQTKIRRCEEGSEGNEQLSKKEIERNIKTIDKNRAKNRELIGGNVWGARENYHLVVNTSDWDMEDLAVAVADFAKKWFARTEKN